MKKIILLVCVLLMTGCYNYNELDELKIVSSIFVDYKDDEYKVTVEVLNTSKEKENASYFIEGSGQTFEESLNDIYTKSTYTPYYSQMEAAVFSMSIAEDKIEYLYDYFTRDPRIRKDFYVFITEDIESLLEFKSNEQLSIGETLKKNMKENQKKNAKYRTSNFREMLNNYLNDTNYFLGSIKLDEENLVLEDTYLIHKSKLNQKIDEKAVLLINLLEQTESEFQIYDEETYEVFQYLLDKNIEKEKVTLDFKGTVRLLNMGSKVSSSVKDIENIEKQLDSTFKEYFEDCIEYAKNIGYDIYNFNYYYYLHFPKLVEEDTWKNLDYEVETRIKINEKGLILDSLGDE